MGEDGRALLWQVEGAASEIWREQGRTSAGGRLGARRWFAQMRGAGSIFQSDQISGKGLGCCWTGVFSANHANFRLLFLFLSC